MSLYVGIDLGTSGCRVIVIDAAGQVCGRGTAPLHPSHRNGPQVEQDPAQWWQSLERALDEVLSQVSAKDIRAIAVDGTSATLLLTDPNGRPVGPALMYDDSRAREQASRIAALAPRESGAHGATSSLAKLLYLQPSIHSGRRVLHQADWIAGRLCGRFGASDENNALKLGYDPVTRTWPAWLEHLGVSSTLLPHVVPPGTPIGTITREEATRWRLSSATLVVAGTTDSVAGFLATGAAEFGEAVTSLGSTLVLKVLSDKPVFVPPHGVYSHRLGDQWLVGGASNSGGAVLLKFFGMERLQELTPRLNPERPTGLGYYPLLRPGERFPVNDPQRRPQVHPRPRDDAVFLQGLLEGIADIEQQGYRLLARLGAPYPRSVRSIGGGAANSAWIRLRQRLLGVPMVVPAHTEAAYGAARLAYWGCNPRPDALPPRSIVTSE